MLEPDTEALLRGPVDQMAYLTACVLAGGVMCFFGRRVFRLSLGLFGALAGGYVAAVIGHRLSTGNVAVSAACGLAGGVLGGVLMVAVYLLGVFVAGATLGGVLAAVFTLGSGPGTRALAVSLAGAGGGLVALFARRFLLVVATALNGAALVIGGLWLLYAGMSPAEAGALYAAGDALTPDALHKYILVCGWATLGCLGAWVQFSLPGHPADMTEEKTDPPPD